MFPDSGLLLSDVTEMLIAFSNAVRFTSDAISHLTDLLKTCAGLEFQYLNINNYTLYHNSDLHSNEIFFHFYCQKCERELIYSSVKKGIKSQKKQCSNCNKENIVSLSNKNFFLSVNFEYEIRFMLEHKKPFRDSIIKKLQSTNEVDNNNLIRDIHDAHLYKETNRLLPNTICYSISTDGAPLHHCSKRGFYFDTLTRYC